MWGLHGHKQKLSYEKAEKTVKEVAKIMNDEMSGYRKKMALLGEKMLAEEEGNHIADNMISAEIEKERKKSLIENQHIHHEFQ